MIKISTSILSVPDRKTAALKLNNTNNDYLHIDVMDGKFVNNLQFSIKEILELEKISTKPLDIHLMAVDPISYIEKLDNLNINNITFHLELDQDINRIISQIKNKGYKVGIAIKPNTNVEMLKKYLNYIDLVLIMSVEPGYGGQSFISDVLFKAPEIKSINPNIELAIDGGVNEDNLSKIKEYNIDMIVVGNYITSSNNYNEKIDFLKESTII